MRQAIWGMALAAIISHVTQAAVQCPWEDPALLKWSSGSSWDSGQTPKENETVVIPAGKKILLDAPIPRLDTLTVDGVLVWDHVSGIKIETRYILVNGEFHIGSEQCKFNETLDIFLYGTSDAPYQVPGFGQKFIGAEGGSVMEIHGKPKKSWTKLVATVSPAQPGACGLVFDSKDRGIRSRPGIWMAVWNSDGSLVSINTFSTGWHGPERHVADFVLAVDNLETGQIVSLAVMKSLTMTGQPAELFEPLYAAVERIGGTDIRKVGPYEPYVLLAIVDIPATALQSYTPRPAGFEDGVEANVKFHFGHLVFLTRSYTKIPKAYDVVRFRVMHEDAAYPQLSFLHDVSSWEVGDEVVVVSTDYDWRQYEVKKIVECKDCAANQIRVDGDFLYEHFGQVTYGVDERAEVGLLTRNIRIEAELQDACYHHTDLEKDLCDKFGRDTYGGHVKVLRGALAKVEGVQLTHMGQQSVLATYPLHFHLCDDVTGMYLRNNVVRDSNSRCVTIHGTDHLEVSDHVCLIHLGHGIFLEDSAEQNNTILRNLVIGTQYGTLLFTDRNVNWCKDRDFCGLLSSIWITHPNNIFEGNVGAGSDGFGFVLAFADRPLGPSFERQVERGLYHDQSTRHTKVKWFSKNTMHSNKDGGLWFDQRVSYGQRDMNKWFPENAKFSLNMYAPRDPPTANGTLIDTVLSELTLYKNQDRNAWTRCGNIIITNSSFADSPSSYQAAHGAGETSCDVRHSIFIGETDNKGQPWTYTFNDAVFQHLPKSARPKQHFDRSISEERPDFLINGVSFYQGPMYVDNCYFDQFKNWYYNDSFIDAWGFRPVRRAAAISFHPNNHYPNIPRNGVSRLQFGFCDGVDNSFRLVNGNASTPFFSVFDGTLNTNIRDYDGSLTGTPNTQIVHDRPFFTGDRCLSKPDWGMAICPYKYFMLVVRGKTGVLQNKYKQHTPVLIRRDDHPEDVYTQLGMTGHKYILRILKSYTIFFNATLGKAPRDIQVRPRFGLENNEVVRLAICLPKSTTTFTINSRMPTLFGGDKMRMVESLEEVDEDDTFSAVFWDKANGYLYFKMSSNYSLDNPDQQCPGNECLEVDIERNDGDDEPAVCTGTVPPIQIKDRYPRVKNKACDKTKAPGSMEGLGAPIERGYAPPAKSLGCARNPRSISPNAPGPDPRVKTASALLSQIHKLASRQQADLKNVMNSIEGHLNTR